MQYISTTDLRTKTSILIEALKRGSTITLIHRSQVVGEIRPTKTRAARPFDPDRFAATLKRLPALPRLSYQEREGRYRKHLEDKYGPRVP